MQNNWFQLTNENQIDSPALLFYKDRIQYNIALMLKIVGDADRLVPHIKTHKTVEIVQMQLDAGINKFKCATIAEAEMLVLAGAKWILLAHQLVPTKAERFIKLINQNPDVQFSSLIDSFESGILLNDIFKKEGLTASIFIDVNNGMNRTGHEVNPTLLELCLFLGKQSNLNLVGLHIYDGHIRDEDFNERKAKSDAAFEEVNSLIIKSLQEKNVNLMLIAGGSPTFTVHALRQGVYCSPGTCLLWDWNYGDSFADQPFHHAALILTRVISKPRQGIITLDLGHKAVSAENPINKRIRFLNLTDYELLSQSEEHGVVQVADWSAIKIGDVLYGLPYHICPSVNLYDEANIIVDGNLVDKWEILARKRKINI